MSITIQGNFDMIFWIFSKLTLLNLDRTTTWQRPTPEHVRNYQHWQSQQGSVMQQCGQRFLYEQSGGWNATNGHANGQTTEEDPLPEGWEKRVDPNNRVYYVNHKNKVYFFLIFCANL